MLSMNRVRASRILKNLYSEFCDSKTLAVVNQAVDNPEPYRKR